MASCPNINTPEWQQLEAVQGETLAYAIWEKFDGKPPAFFYHTPLDSDALMPTAYDTRTRFSEEVNNDILDSIIFMLMDRKGKDDFDLSLQIGNTKSRGAIPNMFLQQSYETSEGTSVNQETAEKLWEAEKAYLDSVRKEESEEDQDVLFDLYQEALEEADAFQSDHPAREAFLDIYEFWNGGTITTGKTEQEVKQDIALGNTDVVGWRELLAQRARQFGYTILSTEENVEFASDEEILERIYSKSRMEENPSKKLTGQMRELLATIPSSELNSLGFKTFLPADQVYKELAATFAGLQNFPEMVAQMETLALHKPKYKAVSDFMRKLDKKQAAMFTTIFAQSANEFLLVRVEQSSAAGDVVRMFNPNENSIERSVATQWKRNSVESNIRKDRPVYTIGEQGQLQIDPKKAKTIGDNWLTVRKAIAAETTVLAPEGEVSPGVQALTNILWEMGMNIGDPDVKEDTAKNLQQLVSKGLFAVVNGRRQKLVGQAAFNYIADRDGRKLARLVEGFVRLENNNTKVAGVLKNIGPGQNIFDTQSRTVRHLASFVPLFMDAKGDSFVNGRGKQIYPINLRHHLGQVFEVLSSSTKEQTEMMQMYREDKFFKPIDGRSTYDSILYRLLQSTDYRKEFRNLDLDALKDVTIPDGTVDYENFSQSDSLRLRLINYINTGNKSLFYASIPIQADRKKFTVFPFVRTKNLESTKRSSFGVSGLRRSDIIAGLIVQDMMRIAHGRGALSSQNGIAPANLNETYVKNLSDPMFMQFDGTKVGSEGNFPIVEDVELKSKSGGYLLSDYIEEFITEPDKMRTDNVELYNEIQTALNGMTKDALDYFNNEAKKLAEQVKSEGITLPIEARDLGGVEQVIKDYVFDDFIARNEISKFLRGSRAHSKDLVTFYKRMGQATTPGVELTRASDLQIDGLKNVDGIPNYGAPDTFNEITLEDVRLDLNEEMVTRANERANSMRDGLIEAGFDEAFASAIADEYRAGEVEGTDAQGAISIDFYRGIMQGRGMWGLAEERAWEAYTAAPNGQKQFVYQPGAVPEGFKAGEAVPVYPIKPYYERNENINGVVTTDSQKNSYHVLLEAETKNNPVKDNLRRRMEATAEYTGLDKIDVANFVTAKKIKINKVTRLTDNLAGAEFNTVDIRGLRFPQDIPTKKASTTMFNRQVRKNTISNIDPSAQYTLNAGLDTETKISGEQLLSMYHGAIEKKIELEFNQVLKELGINDIEKARKAEDIDAANAAMVKFHMKLRDRIKEENLERELPANYDAGLRIITDPSGRPQFEVPLDFPVYFEKYQRIVMSMAINSAFKQKVPGMEAVQVAEIGGFAESGELNFYDIQKDKGGVARLVHMEVMIREDIARKFGLEEGQDLDSLPEELRRVIGYRIPNQGKSSTVIMKIKRVLPANYAKAVVVPAQLTKLTGSDFDIDKLFLMFPEVRKTDAGPVKIRPPYDAIVQETLSIDKISDVSILNNIMLDVVEAVQANLLHADETLAPLDESTLPQIVEELEAKYPNLQAKLEFASSAVETEMGIRNTIGRAMRGLWANFIAGHSVAAYGNVEVSMNNMITLDEQSYPRLINRAGAEVSEFDQNTPINMIGSRYLSAAVDAAKKPYQFALNDRTLTYPVSAYWLSFTGDSKSLHDFLNVPMIRDFTDLFYTKYGGKPMNLNNAVKDAAGGLATNLSEDRKLVPTPMTRAQLNNASELTPRQQYELLLNFLKFREAGQDLVKMFKVISPDSMDGMNSIDSIKSYMSRRNRFSAGARTMGEVIFTNPISPNESVIDQFVGQTSLYPMQRGFSNLFLDTAEMGAKVFPMTISPAMDALDTKIMELTGQDFLSPEAIREIRRGAMLEVLTREGSPLREFFSDTHLKLNYLNKDSNLVTKLRDAKVKYPELLDNPFISKFIENPDNDLPETTVYLLDYDTSYQMTRFEKDSITLGAYRLLNNSNPEIVQLAEDLLMNSLIVHGFRQTSGSYADIIPVSFFKSPRFARYGGKFEVLEPATEFMRKQQSSMFDAGSLEQYALQWLRQNYMRQPGGYSILKTVRRKTTPNEITLSEAEFSRVSINGYPIPAIVVYGKESEESALYVAGASSTGSISNKKYVKVNPLGVMDKLIEATNPAKSIINNQGFAMGGFITNPAAKRLAVNAGEVSSTANEQDIICG